MYGKKTLSGFKILLGQLFSHAAEAFGSNAEVRGDHPLWHPQGKVGIQFDKIHVAFFGCKAQQGIEAFLHVQDMLMPVSYTHLDVYKRQVLLNKVTTEGGAAH